MLGEAYWAGLQGPQMMVTTDVSRWRPGRLCMDAGCQVVVQMKCPSLSFSSNPKFKVKCVCKNHQHVLCFCIPVWHIKSMTQGELQQESQWTKTCDHDNDWVKVHVYDSWALLAHFCSNMFISALWEVEVIGVAVNLNGMSQRTKQKIISAFHT